MIYPYIIFCSYIIFPFTIFYGYGFYVEFFANVSPPRISEKKLIIYPHIQQLVRYVELVTSAFSPHLSLKNYKKSNIIRSFCKLTYSS